MYSSPGTPGGYFGSASGPYMPPTVFPTAVAPPAASAMYHASSPGPAVVPYVPPAATTIPHLEAMYPPYGGVPPTAVTENIHLPASANISETKSALQRCGIPSTSSDALSQQQTEAGVYGQSLTASTSRSRHSLSSRGELRGTSGNHSYYGSSVASALSGSSAGGAVGGNASSRSGGASFGPRIRKEGDWECVDPACGNINFSKRTRCNRCGKSRGPVKPSDSGPQAAAANVHLGGPPGLFRQGDWPCALCGNVNWARRNTCNICSAPKPHSQEEQPRLGRGGGHFDLQDPADRRRHDSDDEDFDEFGRKKRKHNAANATTANQQHSGSRNLAFQYSVDCTSSSNGVYPAAAASQDSSESSVGGSTVTAHQISSRHAFPLQQPLISTDTNAAAAAAGRDSNEGEAKNPDSEGDGILSPSTAAAAVTGATQYADVQKQQQQQQGESGRGAGVWHVDGGINQQRLLSNNASAEAAQQNAAASGRAAITTVSAVPKKQTISLPADCGMKLAFPPAPKRRTVASSSDSSDSSSSSRESSRSRSPRSQRRSSSSSCSSSAAARTKRSRSRSSSRRRGGRKAGHARSHRGRSTSNERHNRKNCSSAYSRA